MEKKLKSILLRIEAPWFVAGVEIFGDGIEKRCAPIVSYMKDWSINKIIRYSRGRGWKAFIVLKGGAK